MGGRARHIAGREKNLPRGPAEIPGCPIDGQDAARVAPVAAAVEKTPGAVLGQDDAGLSDTPSTRRFPPEPRPRRARLILSAVITIKEPHPRLGLDRALEHVDDGARASAVEKKLEAPRDAGAVRGYRRRPP